MNFAPDTQAILDRVEDITKTPIHFVPELDSPYLLAQVTMARGNSHAHVIRYKPDVPGVNYNAAFQCGFILRLYDNPPEERFDFTGIESGRQSVLGMMKGPGGIQKQLGLDDATMAGLTNQLYDGTMLQIRSMPLTMRIDDWIYRDYPGLREEQAASIANQQQTNVKALSPKSRAVAPPTIYNANVAMSAAYALFADRLYKRNMYAIPFRSAGFEDRGQRLLDIFDTISADATNDRALINAFGDELGISDWFNWVPFTGPGGNE